MCGFAGNDFEPHVGSLQASSLEQATESIRAVICCCLRNVIVAIHRRCSVHNLKPRPRRIGKLTCCLQRVERALVSIDCSEDDFEMKQLHRR